MCPVCLATTGLYIAGAVSGGGVTTFLAMKLLRKRPEPTVSTPPTETATNDRAATDDCIETSSQVAG